MDARNQSREVSDAMNALIRSPMGVVPKEAESFYHGRGGFFDVKLRPSVFERLRQYYSADKARQWMAFHHPQLGCSALHACCNGREDEVHTIIDRLDADAYI